LEEKRAFSKPIDLLIEDIRAFSADNISRYNGIKGQKNSKGSAIKSMNTSNQLTIQKRTRLPVSGCFPPRDDGRG